MPDLELEVLVHEIYARFGLAYFQSECLHRELCSVLARSKLPAKEQITRPRVEEEMARSYSLTLGEVIDKLQGLLPDHIMIRLPEALEKRNFLAHHFWFEKVYLMFNIEGAQKLIFELTEYAELFEKLDAMITEYSRPKLKEELGITDEMLQASQEIILAGKEPAPLFSKSSIKEISKKMSKQQKLVRVWESAQLPVDASLIFELADGSLWQLSDIGLGPTVFTEVGPTWKECTFINAYLPANIFMRPRVINPWHYEIALSKGKVISIRPGRLERTFAWSLRDANNLSKDLDV